MGAKNRSQNSYQAKLLTHLNYWTVFLSINFEALSVDCMFTQIGLDWWQDLSLKERTYNSESSHKQEGTKFG